MANKIDAINIIEGIGLKQSMRSSLLLSIVVLFAVPKTHAIEKVLVDNSTIHYGSSISPDGKSMLSTLADEGFKQRRLLLSTLENGKVVESMPLLVNDQPVYGSDASFSPDGSKIFFKTRQNTNALSARTDGNIYVMNQVNGHWGEPVPLPATVNSAKDEFFPISTNSGNLYFSRITDEQSYDIFVSRWNGSHYLEAEKLPAHINTKLVESDAYVSPDEDFMIFVRMYEQGGLGVSDLYISRKTGIEWGAVEHLGHDVNFEGVDGSPSISPDKKWLYFTSNREAPEPSKFDTYLGVYRLPFEKRVE